MLKRWVLSPVIDAPLPEGGSVRRPKAASLIDPARGKPYLHTSVIAAGPWSLSLVGGLDFSALDNDPQCIALLEGDGGEELLAQTPRNLGWPARRVVRLRNRLEARGVDVTGLTADTPLGDWLDALAAVIQATGARRLRLRD